MLSIYFPMKISHGRRNAGLGILLTWCVYIAFVLFTDWADYGLVAEPDGHLKWTITRLATLSVWLIVATLLLRYRKQPVNWQSFLFACIAAGIVAIGISSSLVAESANDLVIAGTIAFYAAVSGFLCVTISKPTIAAGLGFLLFAIQLLVDAIAHVFSGVFRFH